jgi:hypothetical protein
MSIAAEIFIGISSMFVVFAKHAYEEKLTQAHYRMVTTVATGSSP